jgi:hypothetical protein
MSDYLSARKFFESLNRKTVSLVDTFYDEDAVLVDPMVEIRGRDRIKTYYANLYRHVRSIHWEFLSEIMGHHEVALAWVMILEAQNFNGNRPLRLHGASIIRLDESSGKAVYHRDYFDMGAFVYEGLPVLGGLIRLIKKKMMSHQQESS